MLNLNTSNPAHKSYYLGIMSGTSVDGIDIALIEIEYKAEIEAEVLDKIGSSGRQANYKTRFIAGEEFSFKAVLRDEILALCRHQHTSLQALGELTCQLSLAYADAVNEFLSEQDITASQIIAIGCHGQTVFHQPVGQYPFSMQLVNPTVITAKTGITTVTDFRSMDIALGGQGAPLVPLFHQELIEPQGDAALVFLNIGGIANISIVNPKPLVGFDTGPGNVLLDAWIYRIKGSRYDNNGEFSASGSCNYQLLDFLLNEAYFSQPAPKSSGRELFNLVWLENKLTEFNTECERTISDADIMATLVQLTCRPIVDAIKHLTRGQVLVCGGGAKNQAIMHCLQDALSTWQVCSTDDVGISADFMEAMAFAWLAHRCINGLPGNDPKVTGASRAEICGSITRIQMSG